MNFLPIPTILIIFISTLVDFSVGANVLVNAPTMLPDHFLSMKKLAKFLVEHDDQLHVHMLILNTGDLKEKEMALEKHERITKVIFEFDKKFVEDMNKGGADDPHKIVGNKWIQRGFDQNEKILEKEAFLVYKEFLKSEKGHECMKKLHIIKFDSALYDTWDFGAQLIFHLLNIRKVNAFNKIALLDYQMEYAGTLEDLPGNVPEVYAAKIDEDKDGHGHGQHKDEHGNMAKFIKVHDEMDKWFNEEKNYFVSNFSWFKGQQKKIRDLYKENNKLFMESQPMLEFTPFGKGKGQPDNLAYIGGLVIGSLKEHHHKDKDGPGVVIISLEFCDDLVERDENLDGFKAIIAEIDEFHGKHSNYHFHFDCKPDKMKEIIGKKGNVDVDKIEDLQAELAKPSTRLAIINCGRTRILNAIAAAVPIVCVPMIVDQYFNSKAILLPDKMPISTTLDINKLMKEGKKELLLVALNEMLIGQPAEQYLKNAHKLQQELHQLALHAQESGIFTSAFHSGHSDHPNPHPHSHSHPRPHPHRPSESTKKR